MPNRIEALLDAEAENQAEIDARTEEKSPAFRVIYADLLVGTENRDLDVFAFFGLIGDDAMLTAADFSDVPVPERDSEWHRLFSWTLGAAKWQANIDSGAIDADFLAFAKANGQKIRALASRMPRGDLKAAAVQGVGKDRMQAKADARRLRNDKS